MKNLLEQLSKHRWIGAALATLLIAVLAVAAIASPAQAQTPSVDFSQIYDEVSPSVVAINVAAVRNGFPAGGSGSGFVLDNEGHIITNNHVVEGAQDILITFLDGTKATAEIVGLDPGSDLAVLLVDLPPQDLAELIPVTFANTDELRVGQPVVAIGSPFGQRWTLTQGIISALDRTITGLTQFSIGGVIQTDAAVNPGNSGGPLLDAQGRVIGVNSQILSESGSSSGVGFAVPGNLTQRVARELIQTGRVNYSYLGVGLNEVSLSVIEAFNLPNDQTGALVVGVENNGPADRAGLNPINVVQADNGNAIFRGADIIIAANGQRIESSNDLIGFLARETRPGDRMTLTILRNGSNVIDVDVTLTQRPRN